MQLDRLLSFFAGSPAAKLLRSPNAPHIIYFLHRRFKDSGSITAAHSVLLRELNDFLEEIHETDPEVLRDRAETYLVAWSTGDSRWIRRFLDSTHSEAIYELTPHTEDVFRFLSESLDRKLGFVGTESRLKRIIDTLSDIVVRSSADPSLRLAHLRAERDRLEREIRSIESGEAVSIYSSTAIRERFADAVTDLASLQGDFRAVEDCFKSITREVQKKQAEAQGVRGDILGFALAAEDTLKHQDQGVSFDEFVRLILSPSKQEEFESIVMRLNELDVLVEQVDGMRRVRGMIGSLADEAEKVLGTTRRLSTTLRRLLDMRVASGRMHLAEVLRDIRAAAVRLADRATRGNWELEIFAELELANVSERPFWTAPCRFEPIELTDFAPDEDERQLVYRQLAGMQHLNWESMRLNIAAMLRDSPLVTLPELLSAHPPDCGAVQVLGYIQLAHDEGHLIDDTTTETIHLADESASAESERDGVREFRIPRVVFVGSKHDAVLSETQSGGGQ
jgi:hypothetical protein